MNEIENGKLKEGNQKGGNGRERSKKGRSPEQTTLLLRAKCHLVPG